MTFVDFKSKDQNSKNKKNKKILYLKKVFQNQEI